MKKYVALIILVGLVVFALLVLPVSVQDVVTVEMPPAIEFLNNSFYGDITGYEEYIHPEWAWVGNGGLQFEGHDGFQNAIGFWSAVFPDIGVEVLHVVGDDDLWAVGYLFTGTNTVDFEPMGVVATDKELVMYMNAFIYLEDGLVKDCYLTWDWITWFDVLGMPYGPSAEEE